MTKRFVNKVSVYEDLFETWKHKGNYKEYMCYCTFYNKFCVSRKGYDRFFKVINKALFGVGEENLREDEIEDFKQCEFSFEFKENEGWQNPKFCSYLRREVYEI